MSKAFDLLPFNFHPLKGSNYTLISNLSGAFCYLNSRQALECLVKGEFDSLPVEKLDELTAKNFISAPTESNLRLGSIASLTASRIARAIQGPSLFIIVPTLRCDHDCRYC